MKLQVKVIFIVNIAIGSGHTHIPMVCKRRLIMNKKRDVKIWGMGI